MKSEYWLPSNTPTSSPTKKPSSMNPLHLCGKILHNVTAVVKTFSCSIIMEYADFGDLF